MNRLELFIGLWIAGPCQGGVSTLHDLKGYDDYANQLAECTDSIARRTDEFGRQITEIMVNSGLRLDIILAHDVDERPQELVIVNSIREDANVFFTYMQSNHPLELANMVCNLLKGMTVNFG